MGELFLLTIGFIMLSGILAMVDAAVLSVSRAEIEEMVQQRLWGASMLKYLSRRFTRGVVVIVIATNCVNILGPILVGQKAIALFGSTAIGIVTAVLTFSTIIFSEIIPKSLGAHYAPVISRYAAPVILGLSIALFPLVAVLARIAALFQSGKRIIGTEDQIRALAQIGHRDGHIESSERQLIHSAFVLKDKKAQDVMTPLSEVIGMQSTATIGKAARTILRFTYSRYPVFGQSFNDILGIAISKDVLEAIAQGKDLQPITELMREPMIVPAHMRADTLLERFRDERIHLAMVQEHGKTVGLVTLEDVLEELVGDIEDETDIDD